MVVCERFSVLPQSVRKFGISFFAANRPKTANKIEIIVIDSDLLMVNSFLESHIEEIGQFFL